MKRVFLLIAFAFSLCTFASAAQIVAQGSNWNYLDDGSDQGIAWQSPSFDDAAWANGNAQLGYGDGDETTLVGFGPNPLDKFITTYFRHEFQVGNPSAILALDLRMLDDDGSVVYLNGVEVVRNGMPSGVISYLTEATTTASSSSENIWNLYRIDPVNLVAGMNVFAVEIHQTSPDSSDIGFDLELIDISNEPVIRGPYLQMAGSDRMVLRWQTPGFTDSEVKIGAAPGTLTTTSSDLTQTKDHSITLTGLTPDTIYFYSVGEIGNVRAGDDADHWFRTAPVAGTSQGKRVWLLGDCGTGYQDQADVRDAFLSYSSGSPADLMLLLGDNAYIDGEDDEYQTAIFETYKETLRTTPMWSTRGNHERNADVYYDIMTNPQVGELGGMASGTEAYYSFDYANVHFVCLDSQGSSRLPLGAMATWLEADLASTAQPWIIAFWHHPPYTKGSHDSDTESQLIDMRSVFLPILENYGVDLVFSGHSHSYERSFLMDGHYGDSLTWDPLIHQIDGGDGSETGSGAYSKSIGAHRGAIYTTAGSSGKTSSGTLDHPAMFTSMEELGSVVLDVDDHRIDVVFLDENGVVRDEYTVLTEPEGPLLTVQNLVAGGSASFTVTQTSPGHQIIIGASLTGPGPTSTIYGDVAMSPTIYQLGVGFSDAFGAYTATRTVPTALLESTLWLHAVEVTGPAVGSLSNPLVAVVL